MSLVQEEKVLTLPSLAHLGGYEEQFVIGIMAKTRHLRNNWVIIPRLDKLIFHTVRFPLFFWGNIFNSPCQLTA